MGEKVKQPDSLLSLDNTLQALLVYAS